MVGRIVSGLVVAALILTVDCTAADGDVTGYGPPGPAGDAFTAVAAPGGSSADPGPDLTADQHAVVIEGSDPGFASGRVVEITDGAIALESAAGVRVVRFAPDSKVWKEFHVSPEAIELGDWVDARGTPQPDGSLLARSEWVFVNIGRLEGTLEEVSGDGAVVETIRGTRTIEFSPAVEVIRVPGLSPVEEGLSALRPGAAVGMVGLVLPDDGFRATRIWVYEN
ncbi:hypothetical protein [Symbiobacterium terraclitae]|uniref:hypothetical protein n=1 Tax=Symbiobacterium terraclitae TaxID=557451 RepID=UPI0035B566C9